MSVKLYLANLPIDMTEEQIKDLFTPVGEVSRVKMLTDKRTEQPTGKALIWLETEEAEAALLERYNGSEIGGQLLAVSPVKPPNQLNDPTPEEQQLVQEIMDNLGETDIVPCRQITGIVQICGPAFARMMLDETLHIEESGGMPVRDGSRRRTPGGVFFYLTRGRVSLNMQQALFKTLQQPEPPAELVPAPAPKPKADPKPKAAPRPKNTPRQEKQSARQPAAPPPPPAPKKPAPPPPPELSEQELAVLTEKLGTLRDAHHDAQTRLDSIRKQPAQKQVGTFSAIKQVLDLQRQIDDLLKKYPQLK